MYIQTSTDMKKEYTHAELAQELNKPVESRRNEYQLHIVDIADFLAKELPVRENLLEPWLPQQGLAMVYAPRGVGKTFVGLNVAYAVASASEFLNWQASKPNGVLYLDGEMPAVVMQERLAQIVKSHDKETLAPFKILTPDLQPDLMPDLSLPEYQAEVEKHLDDISLIVVDNISTLCRTGKENDSEGWLSVQEWALRMRATGRSVLFIHHAGKSGNQRGTSKREDVLDTVISLKRPADYEPEQGSCFEVHFEKSRTFYGEDAEPMIVSLKTINDKQYWDVQSLEKNTYEKVIELMRTDIKQGDIAVELSINKSTVSRYVKRAKAEGLLQ